MDARPRLVVTDHDPVFLGLLQELLNDEGYEALVPPKLEEPYPFIKEARPAAVVLGDCHVNRAARGEWRLRARPTHSCVLRQRPGGW